MSKNRHAKLQALASHHATPAAEQEAAQAALVRIGRDVKPQSSHLTDAGIRHLLPPTSGYVVHWDSFAGFGCRITSRGVKSFIFIYRVKNSGQQRSITIGRCDNWATTKARDEAKRLRRLVDGGGDPRADDEDERAAPTVAKLADQFETDHLPKKRWNTQDSYRRLLRLYVRPHFGLHAKVADVTYSDIDRLHRKLTAMNKPHTANRCVAVCSKMFSLAIKWQMRTDNPCRGIEKNSEGKRRRYLSPDELQRLTLALAKCDDKKFVGIIMLLLLSGARRGEVLSMRWDAIDLKRGIWTKEASETKQRRDHIVPLSAAALEVLKKIERCGQYVFPSDSKSGHVVDIKKRWPALCKAADITNLHIHDLRHSFASQLVSTGASLPLIGSLLGHSNPSTTLRYSHLFNDVERDAVEKVGKVVTDAGNGHEKI
ncbi:MAG TPA: tyrosine-type recombinase/integrase [Burkholderiaceae bacterium]|jgi:integrase|nr:tyrosine-type recombinase/integrase [Burkholderiaceae bacterium]